MAFYTQCSVHALQLCCSFVLVEAGAGARNTRCNLSFNLFVPFQQFSHLMSFDSQSFYLCRSTKEYTKIMTHLRQVNKVLLPPLLLFLGCCCCCRFCCGLEKPFFFGSNVKRKRTLFDMKKKLFHTQTSRREGENEATRYIK